MSEWEDTLTGIEVESPGKASRVRFPGTQMPVSPTEGNKTFCKLEFSNVISNNVEEVLTELSTVGSKTIIFDR